MRLTRGVDPGAITRCPQHLPEKGLISFSSIYAVCDGERGEASAQLLKTLHKGSWTFFDLVGGSCKTDQVDDTKCKTVFKNAFTTQMETQVSRGTNDWQAIVSAFQPLTRAVSQPWRRPTDSSARPSR